MSAHQSRAELRGGGDENRAQLIESQLPLVRSIARRFAQRGEPLEDLVQVGTIGLIKAVDRYDPARGAKLSTVAAPAIEGEIRHHLRDGASVLRTPQRLQALAGRLEAERPRLTAELGREPSSDELAQAAGATREDAARALAVVAPAPLDEDDAPSAAPAAHEAESRLLVGEGLEALPERERRIVRLRFEQDLSQAEIARREGISQATVSRLLQGALDQLRRTLDGGAPGADGAAAPATSGGVAAPGGGAYSPAVPSAETSPAGKPQDAPAHSGRLLVRMPATLHDELARAAEREGVSLNTLVTGALAGAVGWRDPNGTEGLLHEHHAHGAARPAWLRWALWANVIVVALAAIVAIALLVSAL
jgi:RNA polymerase sigma-B factor